MVLESLQVLVGSLERLQSTQFEASLMDITTLQPGDVIVATYSYKFKPSFAVHDRQYDSQREMEVLTVTPEAVKARLLDWIVEDMSVEEDMATRWLQPNDILTKIPLPPTLKQEHPPTPPQ